MLVLPAKEVNAKKQDTLRADQCLDEDRPIVPHDGVSGASNGQHHTAAGSPSSRHLPHWIHTLIYVAMTKRGMTVDFLMVPSVYRKITR